MPDTLSLNAKVRVKNYHNEMVDGRVGIITRLPINEYHPFFGVVLQDDMEPKLPNWLFFADELEAV